MPKSRQEKIDLVLGSVVRARLLTVVKHYEKLKIETNTMIVTCETLKSEQLFQSRE